MAKKYNIRSVFLYLLAFVGGSSFTWMLSVNRMQNCESQRLDGAFNMKNLFRGMGRIGPELDRNIAAGPRDKNVENDPLWNGTHHIHTAQRARNSLHDIHRTPHRITQNSSKPVRVLCWVMTSPETLHRRAKSVRDTWGPRCDVTLYMSSKADKEFPAVGLNVREGRASLWNKTRSAILYIYQHHFHQADWFIKADDDTYLIVENLRKFLRDKNTSAPVYFGHHFQMYMRQGYMSGGAGYVLSKEAFRRAAEALKASNTCGGRSALTKAEDVAMGVCMMKVGVVAGDSRDSRNRSRFLPFHVRTFFNNELPDWYHQFVKYSVEKGRGCCSDSLISIHYVRDRLEMLMLDYYIHGLQLNT